MPIVMQTRFGVLDHVPCDSVFRAIWSDPLDVVFAPGARRLFVAGHVPNALRMLHRPACPGTGRMISQSVSGLPAGKWSASLSVGGVAQTVQIRSLLK